MRPPVEPRIARHCPPLPSLAPLFILFLCPPITIFISPFLNPTSSLLHPHHPFYPSLFTPSLPVTPLFASPIFPLLFVYPPSAPYPSFIIPFFCTPISLLSSLSAVILNPHFCSSITPFIILWHLPILTFCTSPLCNSPSFCTLFCTPSSPFFLPFMYPYDPF